MFKKTLTLLLSLVTTLAMAAVDVNTASEADLDSIKGIGPGTSAKMLQARQTARFKDWPDLIARVSGIGEKRAARLSAEGLTVNGAKYPPAAAAAPAPKTQAPATTRP